MPFLGDLSSVEVESGVNEQNVGFLMVRAVGRRGDAVVQLTGQMTPDEVRGMALDWLVGADAAEIDAAIIKALGDEAGAHVVLLLRNLRGELR